MGLFNRARVIRDKVSRYNVIYDPSQENGKPRRDYEYCREKIDEAFMTRLITREAQQWMADEMDRIRKDYLKDRRKAS